MSLRRQSFVNRVPFCRSGLWIISVLSVRGGRGLTSHTRPPLPLRHCLGNHMYLSATINGELVIRPYTPVSSDDERGYFELVIKVYFANVHPKFPEGGKMSQYLDTLGIGDTVDVRGPLGKVTYLGGGDIQYKEKSTPEIRHATDIGLIAGGTGKEGMGGGRKYKKGGGLRRERSLNLMHSRTSRTSRTSLTQYTHSPYTHTTHTHYTLYTHPHSTHTHIHILYTHHTLHTLHTPTHYTHTHSTHTHTHYTHTHTHTQASLRCSRSSRPS